MAEPDAVFVYGSLMRGLGLHHYLKDAIFAGEGWADGALVSLGRYPGLVEAPGRVRGELYAFADLAAALDVLDDLEEFDATDPDRSVYVRVARTIALDEGSSKVAWLYRYNRSVDGLERLRDGDWRAFIAAARTD